ncbi:universal stress protein [Propionivibrio sp.]|jgi:nucleotide-binding universal stress UspA family protein|uniref:universal stress protein n=1 Tax=Propionivibrio sp. TaxID=2212460 RepID=UPI0039E4F230
MFQHLLVPTDGSPLSEAAVGKAIAFAKEAGARITAFYAKASPPVERFVDGVPIDAEIVKNFQRMADEEAQRILDFVAIACRQEGVPCATVTMTSDAPYEGIIQTATEKGCDLIFMASHGRRGISALLLGSETMKVLTHSKIPVLVCR